MNKTMLLFDRFKKIAISETSNHLQYTQSGIMTISLMLLLSLALSACAPRGSEKASSAPRVEEVKADSLLSLGYYWKALPYYSKALDSYKEPLEQNRVRAKLYGVFYFERQWDSAFVYAESLRETPWFDSLPDKGIVYFRARKYAELLTIEGASPLLRAEAASCLGLTDSAGTLYAEAEKLLGEVARARRAEVYAQTGKPDSAVILLKTVRRPTSAQKRLLVKLLFESKAYSDLPGAIAVLPGEQERLEALIRLYDMVGDAKKLRRTRFELLRVAPWSPVAQSAAAVVTAEGAEETYLVARGLSYKDAVKALSLFEEAERKGYSSERCRMERAQILYNQKRYAEAYPFLSGMESDEARFLLAKVLVAQGGPAEAMKVLADVAESSQKRESKHEGWDRQATILQRLGRNREAAELCAKGASALGDEELGRRALVLWLSERDTVMAFLALKGGVPLDPDAALFFRTRIFPDSADWILSRLEAKDPFSYYSLSARGDIGSVPDLASWFRELGDTVQSLANREDSILEKQAFTLAEAGFYDEASAKLKSIEHPPLSVIYKWAKWFSELGADNWAIDWSETLLSRARKLGVRTRPMEVLKLQYPPVYVPQIEKEGVDPALFLSLVRQESWFNPSAVSPANAYGLCQLLPGTARGMDTTVTLDSLFDASVSIRLGSRFLKNMQSRFEGREVAYLAAYNAGPGAVDNWLGYLPADDPLFVELVPYDETRNYVKQLLKGEIIYRSILDR